MFGRTTTTGKHVSRARHDLRLLALDHVFSQSMVVLTGGAFMVGLVLALGGDKWIIGLIAAIGPLSQIVQIPAIYLVQTSLAAASTGRFNRVDPYHGDTATPLSLHKYNYGSGNPVANIDPAGLFSLSEGLSVLTTQASLAKIYFSSLVFAGVQVGLVAFMNTLLQPAIEARANALRIVGASNNQAVQDAALVQYFVARSCLTDPPAA